MKTFFLRFCWLLGAGLGLVIGLAGWQGAQAQGISGGNGLGVPPLVPDGRSATIIRIDGPRHKGPWARFYVDGALQDSTHLTNINPNDIEQINVLKNQVAASIDPAAQAVGLVAITTKQHLNEPAVKAFNWRVALLACQVTAAPDWLPGQPAPAGARFFLNGKAVSREKLAKLNLRRLAKIEVLTGPQAADYAHDLTALSVLVATTH